MTYFRAIACLLVVSILAIPAIAADPETTAKELLARAGIDRGVCAVVGTTDGKVALAIVRNSKLIVHVIDPRPANIAAARKTLDVDGLWCKRTAAEVCDLKRLPYADNSIDVLIDSEAGLHTKLSTDDVNRVLRPGGKFVFGTRTIVKTTPKGTDDWSHWQRGPDNNPVSTDKVIKAPYMTQWYGLPFYTAMPVTTVASGGRVFVAMGHIAHHKREWVHLNTLTARNGYNGATLWTRKLPEGYMVHRSAFIAKPDAFHMISGDHCLTLNPETGEKTGEIRIPGLSEQWEWMAMVGKTLYVLSGPGTTATTTKRARPTGHWSWGHLSPGYYAKRVPWGVGTTLTAYDMGGKKVRWRHLAAKDKPLDSRGLAIGGGKVFFYAPDHQVGCLDAESGSLEWTNEDPDTLKLIEEPAKRLSSTPGFRSTSFVLATPKALVFEAQKRQHMVTLSTETGKKLWHKTKVTNNPNPILVDGKLIVGIGPGGAHQALNPTTGELVADLGFRKVNCVRLTATPDSFFVRGEGLGRYDRASRKMIVNGAVRAGCNDGAIPANGLLYVGPWLCDCNLSLTGMVTMCSAGDFNFDPPVIAAERLTVADGAEKVAGFPVTAADWPTYRGDVHRRAASTADVPEKVKELWRFRPETPSDPTVPTAVGKLAFLAGRDGKVRAVDTDSGGQKWTFLTAGPILMPPTLADGRAFVGSGDGNVYALEATTGRLLWTFRAAPVGRKIMVYGRLASTWPVNSGVLVKDNVAYFAAGIIDYDGTYVYAVHAATGKLKWANTTSGHLNKEIRKGVSAQGTMTLQGNRLLMAGGNQVSPAAYDLATGKCLSRAPSHGRPQANRGQEVSILAGKFPIWGGRLLYSAVEKVASPARFDISTPKGGRRFAPGRVGPAFSDDSFVFVNGPRGRLMCVDTDTFVEALGRPDPKKPDRVPNRQWRPSVIATLTNEERRWTSGSITGNNALSVALARNAALVLVQAGGAGTEGDAPPTWALVAVGLKDGKQLWRQQLKTAPVPGGVIVTRDGKVLLANQDGSVTCFGK